MSLSQNKKAILQLESCGIEAKEESGCVYVIVNDYSLELSEFEINFQAELYDQNN